MQQVDEEFYKRADAHIGLSNSQISEKIGQGKVSASNMFSAARFNAWITASSWNNSEELAAAKKDAMKYFVAEYTNMLEQNLDDYIENFDLYMKVPETNT